MIKAVPIEGYPAYTVTSEGEVYFKGERKFLVTKKGRSVKLRIKTKGVVREYGLAKLVAKAFVPNPHNYSRIAFKDGNPHNCKAENIAWVSNSDFTSYRKDSAQILAPRKRRVKKKKDCIIEPPRDASAVEIPAFKGYYITPAGKLFKGDKLVKPVNSTNNKSLLVRIRYAGKDNYLGLAKLIATAFLPNPEGYDRVIFKDRNNKNCCVSNIQWVNNNDYNFYTESFKRHEENHDEEIEASEAMAIPGFPGYSITRNGKVFHGKRRLRNKIAKGRSDRVQVRADDGKLICVAIAKLVAITYLPNPEGHTHTIFKDRNRKNCNVENIAWATLSEYRRFINSNAESYELLGPPKTKRAPEPVWLDPERIKIKDCPGYYITPKGVVYKGYKIVKPKKSKGRSLFVRIHLKPWPKGKYMYLGLAKLVAQHFVPNPGKNDYIIFKDRNNSNCVAENIAWVDGETFAYYSGILKGGKKIVLSREEAITGTRCTKEKSLLTNLFIAGEIALSFLLMFHTTLSVIIPWPSNLL